MTDNKIDQIGGITQILTGFLLLVWWLSMGLLLPQAEAVENFDIIVTHSNWVPINIIGIVAVLIWSIAFYLLYNTLSDRLSKYGFIGFLLGEIGIILYACIQYYETFIWPIVGQLYPELVKVDGALVFGDKMLLIPLLVSGLVLGIGYIFFCIDLLKRNVLSKLLVWFLLIGVVLFGNGILISIRSIGAILMVYSMIRIGLLQYNKKLA